MNINSAANNPIAPTSTGYYGAQTNTNTSPQTPNYHQYQYHHHHHKVYPATTPASAAPQPAGSTQSTATVYKVIDIGTQFCKQYYKMLSVESEFGHKFYSKHSSLIHGTEGDLDAPVCFGLEEIQQRILAMGFSGCRVFISTIDCQASLQGGVVVMALGRMQLRGGVSKKFAQSIFLAEQPTGFFVLNDIFRFIDTEEVQSPIQLSPLSSSVSSAIHIAAPASPSSVVINHAAPNAPPQAEAVEPAARSPAKKPAVEEPVIKPVKDSAKDHVKEQAREQAKEAAAAEGTDESQDIDPSKSSWAELAQTQKSRWGNGVVSGAKGASVLPHGTSKSFEPRHFKTAASHSRPQKDETSPSRAQVPSPVAPSNDQATQRRDRRHFNDNYNPEASIFIGGLKHRLEESVVRQVFGAIGEIKGIEIARECLFVEFVAVETAQSVLALPSINLAGAEVKAEKRRAPRPQFQQPARSTRFVSRPRQAKQQAPEQ